MQGDHLVVSCQLTTPVISLASHALIDNGATGFAFMDEEFAHRHHFPLIPLRKPLELEVIDGLPVASGLITHKVEARLQIRHHMERATFFITQLGHYPLVLGIPWLKEHNATIRWRANTITFDSLECSKVHNAFGRPSWIKGLDFIPEPPRPGGMAFVGGAALLSLSRRRGKDGKPRHEVQTLTMKQIVNLSKSGEYLLVGKGGSR